MFLCWSLFVSLKWMQWIGLPSSTFEETCNTKGYSRLIDSFFLFTNQDCILIIQNIDYSELSCDPKLRWHLRLNCICWLTFIFYSKLSRDTLDLKLNDNWNLSNIHTAGAHNSAGVARRQDQPSTTDFPQAREQIPQPTSNHAQQRGENTHKSYNPGRAPNEDAAWKRANLYSKFHCNLSWWCLTKVKPCSHSFGDLYIVNNIFSCAWCSLTAC